MMDRAVVTTTPMVAALSNANSFLCEAHSDSNSNQCGCTVCNFGVGERLPCTYPHGLEDIMRIYQSVTPRISVTLRRLAQPAFVIAALMIARPASAQNFSTPQAPQIVVSANGEVRVTPDRANIQLGVETQAKTAAAASSQNNVKQTAVLNAIKALGIPAASITTSSFSVSPIQRWDDKDKKTVIDGYQVNNLVVVIVSKMS